MTTSGIFTFNVANFTPAPAPTGKSRIEQPYLFQPIASATVPSRLPDGNPLAYEGGTAIDGPGFGPSRMFIDANIGWKWVNLGGDWVDKNGTAQGTVPWATIVANLAVGAVVRNYTCDLTQMAQYVQSQNTWMAIRIGAAAAARPISGVLGASPPQLTYTYSDGSSETLPVWVLAPVGSSNSAVTMLAEVALPAVVEFKRPNPVKTITNCTLQITVNYHWNGNGTIPLMLVDPPAFFGTVQQGMAAAAPYDAGLASNPNVIGYHSYADGTTYADYCSTAPSFNQNLGSQTRRDPEIYGLGARDTTKLPYRDLGKWISPGANSPNEWQVVPSTYIGDGFEPLAPGIGALRMHMIHDTEAFPIGSTVPVVDGSYQANTGTIGAEAQICIPPEEFGIINDMSVRAYYRIGTEDGGPMVRRESERLQMYKGRSSTGVLSGAAWSDFGGKWGITPMHKTSKGGNSGSSGGPFGFQMRYKWHETVQQLGGPDEGGWWCGMHLFDFLGNNPPGYRYGGEAGNESWGQQGGFGSMLYANKWYCVEVRVKLNSVDQPGVDPINGGPWIVNGAVQNFTPDGSLEVWIDGMLAFRRTGMVFRSTPIWNPIALGEVFDPANAVMACRELGFTTLWNNWYHGGTTKSTVPRTLFMTGLCWTRNGAYVGPMNLPTALPVGNNKLYITGDSLTDPDFSQSGVGPINWALGLLGGRWDFLINSAVSGDSLSGILAKMQSLSTDTYPGWADLPFGGVGLVRGGTNHARYGLTVTSFTATIDAITAYALTRVERFIWLCVPPAGGITLPNQAAAVKTFNDYYKLKAAQNPTRVFFIDDCINVRDATTGAALADYFSPAPDEVHMNGRGSYQMGIDLAAALQALMTSWGLSYPAPAPNVPTDVYPATNQWLPNPTNVGTAGTKGAGWTGTVATGYNISTNGSGIGGTVYLEAADPGDPDQSPWQCIAPVSSNVAATINITCQSDGRAYTPEEPVRMKHSLQWKFQGVDSTKFSRIRTWMMDASSRRVTREHDLYLGDSYSGTLINETLHMIQNWRRTSSNASGAGLGVIMITCGATASSGLTGVFKFRGWKVEG